MLNIDIMKNTSYLWSYILALAGGIVLVMLNNKENLSEIIVFVVGLIFLCTSAFILCGLLFPGKKAREEGKQMNPLTWFPVVAGLVFGIILIAIPGFFTKYLTYTFGGLLALCGLIQLSGISGGMRSSGLSGWFLAIPVIMIVIGIILIITGNSMTWSLVLILSGVSLICFGINGIVATILGKRTPNIEPRSTIIKEIE